MQAVAASLPIPTKPRPSDEDGGFDRLLVSIQRRFAASAGPLFRASVPDALLYDVFLDHLPAGLRQHYTCRACRHFAERWGGLLTVDARGRTFSAVWPDADDVPPVFRVAVRELRRMMDGAEIASVFLTAEDTLGHPVTGEWTHIALDVPERRRHRGVVQSADQAAAERGQDRLTLLRGLDEFPAETVRRALSYLTAGGLYRSEKAEGAVKWLLNLHEMRKEKYPTARENLLWHAAATAPPGFCHVKSGMVGTLLEDIAAGLPLEMVKARWAEKMDPLQYQRPQAAPAAGTLARAETIVAKLQSAGALARRFARLADVGDVLWAPPTPGRPAAPSGPVFGHLQPKDPRPAARPLDMPAQVITWEKLQRLVLPDAAAIEFSVPSHHVAYMALVTAADPAAPPILQWDRDEQRNPVSWYLYNGGSAPERWNLSRGTWCAVRMITPLPPAWYGGSYPHHGERAILLLNDCRDTQHQRSGGFFPEQLRSEYHEIRAAMEAYARQAPIAGRDEPDLACGIGLTKGTPFGDDVKLRITTKAGLRVVYTVDRWD